MRMIGLTSLLVLGLLLTTAPAASAAPPTRVSGVGDVFDCGDISYTVTSGELLLREDVHTAASGATHVNFHLVANRMEAMDPEGNSYRIVGVASDNVHYDEQGAITGEHFSIRMRVLAQGGEPAGIVHLSFHVHRDGRMRFTFAGSCTAPNTN